ncbi:MAG: DUF4349 domain-containing protein [Anaerolineae bacterium]|nr:DUF4349 domain-containing protein [Gemmatimonadaceae bacterium]
MKVFGSSVLALLAVIVACTSQGDGTESRATATYSADVAELKQAAPPMAPSRDEASNAAGVEVMARAQEGGAPRPNAQSVRPGADSVAPSMIIRTGSANIEVDSLELAIEKVRLLAQRVGGYIANTSIQSGGEQMRAATLEIKLPANRWGEAISGLRPIGKVEAVNESAEDVGEEFVDLTARVTNARRLEERLVVILATRTGKLSDVLAVERELARVREEIERHEGRLRYLRTRVAVSTLSVTVHEPAPIVGEYRGSSVIGEAFKNAWRNFVAFMAGLIASLGFLIPLGVIVLVAALLARRFWRRRPPRAGENAKGDTGS